MKMKLLIFLLWTLFCNIGCETKEEDIFKEGLILYMPPLDNCNGYVVEVGKTIYYPNNLNDEFKTDSLRVKLTFDELNDYHNCGFGGSIKTIEILKIIKL